MPQPFSVPAGDVTLSQRTDLGTTAAMAAGNPVGRTVAELELLLMPILSGQQSRAAAGRIWPLGQTIAFILVSCGIFWSAAAFIAWTLL